MRGSIFQTNPIGLYRLLDDCRQGTIQLPDFQRGWVWDEDRIKSLIASISQAFPVGALMSLGTGGPVGFKPRPIEGAPTEARQTEPQWLLLDGQQRMTSLYQATLRGEVVKTVTSRQKKVLRWFYIDIEKSLDSTINREEAILGIPEDRMERRDFGREVTLDLSKPEKEYAELMYPVARVFDWDEWQDGFDKCWAGDDNTKEVFRKFKKEVLENFKYYDVPVIALDRETTREAVCVVFEKVNTGGKPLDAFELVTAMYAASGHELRRDWYGDEDTRGRHGRPADIRGSADSEDGILAAVSNTDFLQAVSLFYTRERRREAEQARKSGKELPAVSGNRQALLDLPLDAYRKFEEQVEQGFIMAAKFLHMQHIYCVRDLPYKPQLVPLAGILADIGEGWEHEATRAKLVQWYWNGVFGELYGSAVDARVARDFVEVPMWLRGGGEPSTVSETIFRADRLKTMRIRISAAYKGVNALLMKEGARDFRSGQEFGDTVFFGENVDIHHIFPRAWCEKRGINKDIYNSIINKTPLSYRTNRIIGGVAPSDYIVRLEKGSSTAPPIDSDRLDGYLCSHMINPVLLRSDDFEAFMVDRQKRLLELIERAMGKPAHTGSVAEEGEDIAEADLNWA